MHYLFSWHSPSLSSFLFFSVCRGLRITAIIYCAAFIPWPGLTVKSLPDYLQSRDNCRADCDEEQPRWPLWGGRRWVPQMQGHHTSGGWRGKGVKCPGEPASPSMTADLPGAGGTQRHWLTPRQKLFSVDERNCSSSVCAGLRFRLASGWLLAGWVWRSNSCFSSGWPEHHGDWELYTSFITQFSSPATKNEQISNHPRGEKEKTQLFACTEVYFLLGASRRSLRWR